MDTFSKLSTLSTRNIENLGDYLMLKKERTFCVDIIKMRFERKK